MRVLWVEDDFASARDVSLTANDMMVDVAQTGAEACARMQHDDYDIVVLDLTLSDMAGHELIRRMPEKENKRKDKGCRLAAC